MFITENSYFLLPAAQIDFIIFGLLSALLCYLAMSILNFSESRKLFVLMADAIARIRWNYVIGWQNSQ